VEVSSLTHIREASEARLETWQPRPPNRPGPQNATGVGMDFVCSLDLVVGLSIRDGLAEIDVNYVLEARLLRQTLEHCVEPVDDSGQSTRRNLPGLRLIRSVDPALHASLCRRVSA